MGEILQKKMKYFVISDIHSFYDEMMKSLNEAGYDKDNPEHFLIVCGDIFDRGTKPLEVYKFLKSIPKTNRIFVKGNHEYLLEKLVERECPLGHDYHNGTYDTLFYIAGMSYSYFNFKIFELRVNGEDDEAESYMDKTYEKLFKGKKIKEILKWIDKEFVDYYELDEFIFVHSLIPTYSNGENLYNYWEGWRDKADKNAYYQATWGNPADMVLESDFANKEKGKTLVCGHFHTSHIWEELDGIKYSVTSENPTYYSDKHPELIALDSCTVYTKALNVLVINEDDMEIHDHDGKVRIVARRK